MNDISLTTEEWEILESLNLLLTPFKDITEIISSANTPTISLIIPLCYKIKDDILKVENDS